MTYGILCTDINSLSSTGVNTSAFKRTADTKFDAISRDIHCHKLLRKKAILLIEGTHLYFVFRPQHGYTAALVTVVGLDLIS
jgi:hypothetical protein